jgi:hypothetical protein
MLHTVAHAHQVRNEIAVLKRVSMGHRNILTLVDYFETMNNRTRNDMRLEATANSLQSTWSLILLWEASCSTASAAKETTTSPMLPISSGLPSPLSPICTTTASCIAT